MDGDEKSDENIRTLSPSGRNRKIDTSDENKIEIFYNYSSHNYPYLKTMILASL